jgi:Flp pilus assembly protein TadG
MNVKRSIFEVNSMKTISCSFIRRLLSDKCGQSMVWVAVSLTGLLGMAGLTLDVGRAYVVRSQLQSVVDAAAISGVSGLSAGASQAQDNAYTVEANSNQASWGFPQQASGYPTANAPAPIVKCLNAMMPSGQSCGTSSILNSVQVTETVYVPTLFMRHFGFGTLPVSATATATPAESRPWIVEIILDTTPSMSDTDSNCTGASTAEACALIGIQGMLAKLNPCPSGTTGCTAATANIRFGLMTFPNILTSDSVHNFNSNNGAGTSCNSGTIKFQLYSNPVPPKVTSYNAVTGYPNVEAPVVSPASYTPITYGTGSSAVTLTYQPTYGAPEMTETVANGGDANGFYINWHSATDASGLNPSSTLVQAIGRNADKVNPCLQEPAVTHSGNTSFAQVIYAAETALLAEQGEYPVVNNLPTQTAIVFLSDGQANALAQDYAADGTAVTSNGMNKSGKSYLNSNNTTPSGTYPSGIDACQQAITAAQYAVSLGTRVYTVAYGAENGGCLYYSNGVGTVTSTVQKGTTIGTGEGSDIVQPSGNPLIVTGTLNVPMTSITDVVPCNTIKNMASDMAYFYSDANEEIGTGTSGIDGVNVNCTSPDHSAITSLNDIFLDIYGSLTAARLIPNGTT